MRCCVRLCALGVRSDRRDPRGAAPGGVAPGCEEAAAAASAIRSARDPGGNSCWPSGSGVSAARGVVPTVGEAAASVVGDWCASRGGGAGRELLRRGLAGVREGVCGVAMPSSSEMDELSLVSHSAAEPPAKMFRSVVATACCSSPACSASGIAAAGLASTRAGDALTAGRSGASPCGGEFASKRSYTCSSFASDVRASTSRCLRAGSAWKGQQGATCRAAHRRTRKRAPRAG